MQPELRNEVLNRLNQKFGLSQRRSCDITSINRSTIRYKRKPNNDHEVVDIMKEIVRENPRYGCEMVHYKIRQRGFIINHKRIERLYRLENMQIPKRTRRRKRASESRVSFDMPQIPGVIWSIDFVSDRVVDRKLKVLTSIDPATNESPVMWADYSITGSDVVSVLDHAVSIYGKPKIIRCDNGPEFIGMDMDKWCFENNIEMHFSRPGKPVDNCYAESFNSRFRDECLNTTYFSTLTEARTIIEKWRVEYNELRPQKRFKGLTPSEYKRKLKPTEN